MMDQTLLHPLLPAQISNADRENGNVSLSSAPAILLRVLTVAVVGAISLLANHEASKGFSVTIINDVSKASPVGKKFHLFYVSNDEATRIILNAASSLLLRHARPCRIGRRKEINHVILRFSGNVELGGGVSVVGSGLDTKKEFEIRLSSSLMEGNDFDYVVRHALRCAVARIWLWREEFETPQLVSGTDEYLAMLASFGGSQILSESIAFSVI